MRTAMIVTAPLPLWILSVHSETGADVTLGAPVVDLDGYGVERQLAKLRSRLELARVSETRLSDEYLKRYIYPPMDELVRVRREEVGFHERGRRRDRGGDEVHRHLRGDEGRAGRQVAQGGQGDHPRRAGSVRRQGRRAVRGVVTTVTS